MKYLYAGLIAGALLLTGMAFQYFTQPSITLGATPPCTVAQGCTGTSTVPVNYVLIGKDALHLQAVATSSLGLGGGSGTVTSVATTYPVTGGTFTTSGTIALAFGTTTANTWSAQNIFTGLFTTNATTTNATSTLLAVLTKLAIPFGASPGLNVSGSLALDTTNDQLKVGDGTTQAIFDQRRFYSFGYATSTTWTGTTTLNIAPYPVAGTLTGMTCTTDTGTVGVDLFYGPTPTHLAYVRTASTTANFFNFTSSNTPTANASSSVSFGTPASTPTSISCTATFTVSGT